MTPQPEVGSTPNIVDHDPTDRETLRRDVLDGLGMDQKFVPSKYLYDDEGARIFDRITELREYYPTRTETQIFHEAASEIASFVGPRAAVIEPGGGNGEKIAALVDQLEEPVAMIPIDISMDYVQRSAEALGRRFPGMEIVPVCGDFTQHIDLPEPERAADRNLVFFPGSTVGNFAPGPRAELITALRDLAGTGGLVLLGVDLVKAPGILLRAYDDSERVTAEFNFNLLRRLNRELDADFDTAWFDYLAEWNEGTRAVDMFLVSKREQTVKIAGEPIRFAQHERIHTESSYKFEPADFIAEFERSNLAHARTWTDPHQRFAVMLFNA